jgi:hypothetical protein
LGGDECKTAFLRQNHHLTALDCSYHSNKTVAVDCIIKDSRLLFNVIHNACVTGLVYLLWAYMVEGSAVLLHFVLIMLTQQFLVQVRATLFLKMSPI